ncbi:hypothetical protein K8R43_04435 [archaeon]|nr:hypothetical protein [archaeon]
MNKLHWILVGVVSLVISIIINFNSVSFVSFVGFSLGLGAMFFVILALVLFFVEHVKAKNTKKAVIFGVPALILIIVVSVVLFVLSTASFVSPAVTPDHFRTNILTGQCDFGGGNPNKVSDPWYYSDGCDLSKEELIEVMKSSGNYDYEVAQCQNFCQYVPSDSPHKSTYCYELYKRKGTQEKISCEDLVECPNVTCF